MSEMTVEEAMEVVMRQKTKGMLGREGVVQFIQAARVLAKRCEELEAALARHPTTRCGNRPIPGDVVYSVEGDKIAVRECCGLINALPLERDQDSPSGFRRTHHAVHRTSSESGKGPTYKPLNECYYLKSDAEATLATYPKEQADA